MNSKKTENIKSFKEVFFLKLKDFYDDKFVFFTLCGIIISYFYNLPVLKYSIKGDNEFRLYDLFGVLIFYHYYQHRFVINAFIKNIFFMRKLRKFMYWAILTFPVSLVFYILNDALISFLQVVLYMYHFWVFFLASVFVYVLSLKRENKKKIIYLIIFLSIVSCLIVILQNFLVVDFLWSEAYRKVYGGFLSGTLGPNKVVLGITSFLIFAFSMGLLLEKKSYINKFFVIASVLINLYVILISGSRTTYLACLVFLGWFLIKSPIRFLTISTFLSVLFISLVSYNPDLFKSIDETLNNRIFGKLKQTDEEDVEVGDLYADLGSGRDRLAIGNAIYLLENPLVIPFGIGFVNHFDSAPGKSAHNMYLQVIKETGVVGFVLYFGWLISYLFVRFKKNKGFSIATYGLVFSMLVTLFFGEHLYIYRPLFGILGLFLLVMNLMLSELHKLELDKR